MPNEQIDDLAALQQRLGTGLNVPPEKRDRFLAAYKLADAAFKAAGYSDDDASARAVGVATTRLDDAYETVAINDEADATKFEDGDLRLIVDAVEDFRVVRHDADTGTLTIDVPLLKLTALSYTYADGVTVFEAKRPEDFTTPRFLSGIPGKPVTQIHPRKHFSSIPDAPHIEAMTPEEAASRTFGVHHLSNDSVWVEGNKVWARVTLFEPKLVNDVLLGAMRQVSTGIVARVIDEVGEIDGVKYTRRQVRPVYDHLAFVPRGRCGPECAAKVDGTIQGEDDKTSRREDMSKEGEGKAPEQEIEDQAPRLLRIGDAQIALCPKLTAEQVADAQAKIDALIAEKTTATQKVVDMQKDVDRLQGANDGAGARIAALEGEVNALKDSAGAIDDRFDERVEIVTWVHDNVPDYEHKGKTIAQMKADAVKALVPDVKLDGKSEEYVAGLFDALRDQRANPVGENNLRGRNDSPDNEDETAPRRNLHRKPAKPAGTK